jgi:hypothetical protein
MLLLLLLLLRDSQSHLCSRKADDTDSNIY